MQMSTSNIRSNKDLILAEISHDILESPRIKRRGCSPPSKSRTLQQPWCHLEDRIILGLEIKIRLPAGNAFMQYESVTLPTKSTNCCSLGISINYYSTSTATSLFIVFQRGHQQLSTSLDVLPLTICPRIYLNRQIHLFKSA